jgi:hypothetical protein
MTADQIRAAYARVLQEPIVVRRYTGTGTSRPHFDVEVRGKASQYDADELIGTIQQGDQKVIFLADDLVSRQFALPVISSDKIVVRGKELAIINPGQRKAPDGTLIAYEIQVRG